MHIERLLRVESNVSDLDRLAGFYEQALGFTAGPERDLDPVLCDLFGVRRGRARTLRLGGQEIGLTQCDPPGEPYPALRTAADQVFQHCALVTPDIAQAYARLQAFSPTTISRGGPGRRGESRAGRSDASPRTARLPHAAAQPCAARRAHRDRLQPPGAAGRYRGRALAPAGSGRPPPAHPWASVRSRDPA